MKPFRLHLLSLALFLSAAGVLMIAAELALRWSSLSESAERRDHVERTAWTPARLKGDYAGVFWGIPFRTNRFGFRDEADFPIEPKPTEFRVLSLGDSIGFGLGVEAPAHYTKVAERLLIARCPNRLIRVVNAGGQGFSPSGYAVYLSHEGLGLSPDVVIVEIEVCNDLSDEALLGWHGRSPEGGPERVVGGRYQVSWDGNLLGTYTRGNRFFERTYLYTVLARRILNLSSRFATESDPTSRVLYSLGFDQSLLTSERIEEGWTRLQGSIEAMAALLDGRGIDFILMLMPSRYVFESVPDYTGPARKLLDRARSWAAEAGITLIDTEEALRRGGGEALFFDFAHLREEGNRVVGEVLAERLGEALTRSTSAGRTGSEPFEGPSQQP